jgi:hypothetical protein
LRPHGQALFTQQRIAINDQVQIGPSKQALTRDKQGRLLALKFGNFFFQAKAVLKDQCRLA